MLASSSLAFEVVKWLGVTYLVWLGYKKWSQTPLDMKASGSNEENKKRQFWVAAFVNITNPKATILLLALFPQFIDIHADTQVTQYVVMGTTLILTDIVVMIGYASLAAKLAHWMSSKKHQVVQNRIFGGMFIFAAAVMTGYRSS